MGADLLFLKGDASGFMMMLFIYIDLVTFDKYMPSQQILRCHGILFINIICMIFTGILLLSFLI